MFFIVPSQKNDSAAVKVVGATSASEATEPSNKRRRVASTESEGNGRIADNHRRRTPRACDRCRLKKAKCSGGSVCAKCRHDGVVCVTALAPRKDEHIPRPGYVHLIESQRDQLAQALQKVLQGRDTSDLARTKTLLASMGVAVDSFDFTNASQDNDEDQDAASSTFSPPQTISPSWDDVFNNLDEPQLEAMELFSVVTTPPVPGLCQETSFESSNPGDSPLIQYTIGTLETPSSHLELTDFLQMYDSESGTMLPNDVWNEEADFDSMLRSL